MSQHYFYTKHENEESKITMGWDRPLQGYFMVIEKNSDKDDPFWSNLDYEKSHSKELDDFLSKLDQFKIKIPQQMIDEIIRDGKNGEGNKEIIDYIEKGIYKQCSL